MGKDYTLPKIEEVAPVVTASEKAAAKTNTASTFTLTDVYIKGIDELGEYAAGKLGFANIEARQTKALEFIKLFDNLLKQEYKDVRVCLRRLLVVIGQNPEPFVSGSVFATYYTIKKFPYGYKLNRFIETMVFFSSLQENLKNAGRFVAGRDLPTIFKDWPRTERDNLIMFATAYNN